MTSRPANERTGDDATRIERRRPPKPGMFRSWQDLFSKLGVILIVLLLFVIAGADLVEWIFGNG